MKKQCDLLRPGELLPKWNCEKCEEKGITKTFFLDASYKRKFSFMHHRVFLLIKSKLCCVYVVFYSYCLLEF